MKVREMQVKMKIEKMLHLGRHVRVMLVTGLADLYTVRLPR